MEVTGWEGNGSCDGGGGGGGGGGSGGLESGRDCVVGGAGRGKNFLFARDFSLASWKRGGEGGKKKIFKIIITKLTLCVCQTRRVNYVMAVREFHIVFNKLVYSFHYRR